MILRKIIFKFLVVSLFGLSMLLGSITHGYAASPGEETIVKDDQQLDWQQPIDELTPIEVPTSKVLLDNNEELDKIVKENQLTVDNVIESQKESPVGQRSFSNKDIEMMAKMVYGESRGEDLKGQVAVAAVIINRVESPKFPDTVSNVLNQNGAFSAMNDGQFHKTPDHKAYKAVYLAIKGMDPTKDAIFYYNPKIATSDWIFSREKTTKIGKHVFAR